MSVTYPQRFAYTVDRLDELEPPVCAALAKHVAQGETVRRIVVAPCQNHLEARWTWRQRISALLPWQLTPTWVLVLTTRRLIVATIAQPGVAPTVTAIPATSLLWIELGSILLLGWLECAWVGDDQVQRVRVYFNTVSEELFRWIRAMLCTDLAGEAATGTASREQNRKVLEHLPFKFKGMIAWQLLLPGERVDSVVFQPAIWRTRYRLLRFRQAPARALVLTNLHLLIAEEEQSFGEKSEGLIARHYPLGKLRGAALQPSEGSLWLKLRTGVDRVEESHLLQFEQDAKPALVALLDDLERIDWRNRVVDGSTRE